MKFPSPRPPQFLLRVRKSSSGLGLFAEEEIPKGRFVIEYHGTLMSDEKAQKIGGRYLFELENGNTIVGTMRSNTARYANHSCKGNTEVRIKGNRVFLFSTKKITSGDEITFDYGQEYHDVYIKPNGCRCSPCAKKRTAKQKKTK